MGQPYNVPSNSNRHIYFPEQSMQAQAPPPPPAPLQPSVQINIQPLIKPIMPASRAAPIVYSFGQSNKLFSKPGGDTGNNRRVSWGKMDGLDGQDDFADILG